MVKNISLYVGIGGLPDSSVISTLAFGTGRFVGSGTNPTDRRTTERSAKGRGFEPGSTKQELPKDR